MRQNCANLRNHSLKRDIFIVYLILPFTPLLVCNCKPQWEKADTQKNKNKNKDHKSSIIISCGYLLGRRDWCIPELPFQPLLWISISISISFLGTRKSRGKPFSRLPPSTPLWFWERLSSETKKQKAKFSCVRVGEAIKLWIFEKGN